MSVLAYYLICDSPSEIGLEEFTQRTTMKSRTENNTVENKKNYIITMLHSPWEALDCQPNSPCHYQMKCKENNEKNLNVNNKG